MAKSQDLIPVFEIGRGNDVDLQVALPASWAARHDQMHVVFEHWDICGWHAFVDSGHGGQLLSFPWCNDVDKMLSGEFESELPPFVLPDAGWDDLEQGWWAAARVRGDLVFLAETDFDRLLDVSGEPVGQLVDQGCVELSGVGVTWSCVPLAAWVGAWEAARASCVLGKPSPSRPARTSLTGSSEGN